MIQKFLRKGYLHDVIPKFFERYPGSDGQPNAYGQVYVETRNSDYPTIILDRCPIVCMHGGSQWLCGTCAQNMVEGEIINNEMPK